MNDLDRTQRVVEVKRNSISSNDNLVITFSGFGSTTRDMSEDCVVVDTVLPSKAENFTAGSSQCASSTSNMETDVVVTDPQMPDLIIDEAPLIVVPDDADAAPELERIDMDTSAVLLCDESDNDDIVWLATLPVTKSDVKLVKCTEKSVLTDPKSSTSSSFKSMKEGSNKTAEISAQSETLSKHVQVQGVPVDEVCVDNDNENVDVPVEIGAVAATSSSSSISQPNNKHRLPDGDADEPIIVSVVQAAWPVPQFSALCDGLFPDPPRLVVQPQNQIHLPELNPCIRTGLNCSRRFPNMDLLINRPSFNLRQVELRPIAIDGSNVAFNHGRNQLFSCRGIQLCIEYFVQRGHTTIKAFVPQFRRQSDAQVIDRDILEELGKCQLVVFTPSRKVLGQTIVCHDDRFVLEYAERSGAVIVSNDNFREFQNASPAWEEIIRCRLLMYAFADDIFMVPSDPLGRHGLNLDNFLCF